MDEQQAVEQQEPAAPGKHDALVEEWFRRCIHDSVVSRHTEVFNHVRASVDELKRALSA